MKHTTPQPRRVLRLIARLNVGGPARHVAWLMEELDPADYDQTLAAGRVQDGEDDLGPELAGGGLAWEDLPRLGRAISPRDDLASLGAVLKLLARTRPHVLATHASKAGLLGRVAALVYRPWARLRGWPRLRVVHTFHGHTFHSYFGPIKGRLFLGLERFLAATATWRIVTISPRQYAEIVEQYKVGRPEKAVVVPLGIDLAPFADPAPGRARFRAELQARPNELLIGAVGRIAPVKNFALFFETAAALRELDPALFARCRFLLIGGGSPAELAELQGEIERHGLGEHAALLGVRSDREAFFPGLDALMVTSNNEGTPVSILEGGACGLPVVSTEVGGVPDLLGETQEDWGQGVKLRPRGVTAPVGDARALARGLARVLAMPELAQARGAALKDHVEANHGKQRLAADIARLYGQAGS